MQSSVRMQKGAEVFEHEWDYGIQVNNRKDRKINFPGDQCFTNGNGESAQL